ncbi:MAG TPA: NADH-quinone oxidoreductase subunit L [Chloroflexota bacterium]|nr:NADH-quinone oxidoreductase subunit L [Chloroflexota bacterium]
MQGYAWLLLALPLLGFAINGALGRRLSRPAVSWIGCGSIGLAFIVAIICYGQLLSWTQLEQVTRGNFNYYTWVTSGALKIEFGMLIDPLSTMMLLIITGVGFLIHVYSVGYMHDDRDYSRFFAYMNVFIFSMVLLVVANNFLFLLVGWALVGLSSYLLIGFWYQNMAAVLAARKAFIMNVIGDVGIMIAIFIMFRQFGTLDYDGVFSRAGSFASGDHVITAICLLLLVGAVAKSAQLPLHTWLPDAMEGPTPVSALIHAATMVTAGVYLVARCHVLYDLAPFAALLVACMGTVTAFIAATIAVVQMDIKRVLAYSTMSQIGYMFLGVGDGAYASGMFHLMTHAFFKALLFMGAGSVIHALGGEQDLRKMGGLRSRLPRTYLLFTVGVLAISGVPPLAGFWSKDEILTHTLALGDWHIVLWVIGEITAALTVFYMFRLWYLCFHGRSRIDRQVAGHLHEAPPVMLAPMAILAVLSVVGGFIQTPFSPQITNWLTPDFVLQYAQVPSLQFADVSFSWGAFALIILLIIGAWALARDMYAQGLRGSVRGALRPVYTFLVHKWYFDELYNLLVEQPTYALARLSWWLDRRLIDGLVNGVTRRVGDASDDLRPIESGFVRTYALSLFAGVVLVVAIAVSQR